MGQLTDTPFHPGTHARHVSKAMLERNDSIREMYDGAQNKEMKEQIIAMIAEKYGMTKKTAYAICKYQGNYWVEHPSVRDVYTIPTRGETKKKPRQSRKQDKKPDMRVGAAKVKEIIEHYYLTSHDEIKAIEDRLFDMQRSIDRLGQVLDNAMQEGELKLHEKKSWFLRRK